MKVSEPLPTPPPCLPPVFVIFPCSLSAYFISISKSIIYRYIRDIYNIWERYGRYRAAEGTFSPWQRSLKWINIKNTYCGNQTVETLKNSNKKKYLVESGVIEISSDKKNIFQIIMLFYFHITQTTMFWSTTLDLHPCSLNHFNHTNKAINN